MGGLLKARQESTKLFGWVYSWNPLDVNRESLITVGQSFRQPDTTRIKWHQPEGGNSRGANARTREVSADVVPDKGLYGTEYVLVFTIREF